MEQYNAYRPVDANGFVTFLSVEIDKYGEIRSVVLDASNDDNEYKSTSKEYNDKMFAESKTYYRHAIRQLEKQILQNKETLDAVSGATVISEDAQLLLDNIHQQFNAKQAIDHKDVLIDKIITELDNQNIDLMDFIGGLIQKRQQNNA